MPTVIPKYVPMWFTRFRGLGARVRVIWTGEMKCNVNASGLATHSTGKKVLWCGGKAAAVALLPSLTLKGCPLCGKVDETKHRAMREEEKEPTTT